VLAGQQPIANARERLAFAQLCYLQRRFAAAARFYEEALAERPDLAGDLTLGYRYSAACSAALAATGAGQDAGSLGDERRARWRRQARDWLRADLRQHARELELGAPTARATTAQTLQLWLLEPSLKGLRDEEDLARLPAAERQECAALWGDVRELIRRARRP
jgi:hypothetical protein